ncbi:MAG: hypothetical protein CMN59_01250 [Sphingobium sp.]|uniref:DUF1109 domain-containing protein n=1 Tax=Sphingobium soli TaxID=1591116 RepID=A0ABS8HBV5_9SPHN|nr:DUF1109 domain-containing protein [Sphingobium soli]MAX14123.1 hypothetical protein [Sphingobium sp.]MCC4234573.1 DUF1109 domain-containing protein [Sphingobium soli]
MNTDDLILRLARDTRPVRRGSVWRRIAIGVAIGGMVAALLTAIGMGMRPDLGVAMQGPAFWIKWGYTLSLSAVALAVTAQLARPDTGRVRGLWLIAVPVMLLACLGFLELARTPPSAWLTMWLGQSWKTCPWRVLSLSAPIFAGLLWSFRKLAPSRLRAAGAAAGLSAGAFAATVYCLHCPEVSAIFVLTWYSLGILLATLLGALLGPRLLRW